MPSPVPGPRPLLLVDIDGVLSLFGPPAGPVPDPGRGRWHQVEGVAHFLSADAAGHLTDLQAHYDLVWCSGWEEKANEHLPHLLGVGPLPTLSFDRNPGRGRAHWKLAAIDAYAGPDRPVAWVDDALDDACRAWADERPGPTLLVVTASHAGLGEPEADALRAWARHQAGPGR